MRPTRSSVAVVAVALAACLAVPAPPGRAEEPGKAQAPELADVEADRLAELERRVEELSRDNERLKQERDAAIAKRKSAERRVTELERRLERSPMRLVPAPVPQRIQPAPAPVPEGWSPRQFNGITYYVIPLGQRQAPSPTIAK